MTAVIVRVGELVDHAGTGPNDVPPLSFDVDPAWAAVQAERASWVSYGTVSG